MKKAVIITIIALLLVVAGGYFYVRKVVSTGFDIDKTVYITISDKANFDSVVVQIKDVAKVKNIGNFKRLASAMKYPQNMKQGRYAIQPDMDILDAVHVLKSGHQTPVQLTFNNIRTKQDLTERVSQQLMLSDSDLYAALSDSVQCAELGFTTETIVCMFIPNTYEMYWNVSLPRFLERMRTEYDRFWNDSRKSKAKSLDLSPVEVSVLASIVEEECYKADEYPVVAGLYLNRLKKGMKLQADPTVKFAVGDFTLRRVLDKHLAVDSPYNTYKYQGLPPGPIRIPSIKAIDGVLNHATHDYLYMCAKDDFSGRHSFAKTHAEHERNAARYHAALNKRGIYR
ncbi:MAG: endolytic transglycosylase MltG [Dysgonomonas sp.]